MIKDIKVNTAIILCAGYGKRLKPLTHNCPKPLLKINQNTLLKNNINFIKKIGVKKIFINSFFLKNRIKEYINKNNFNISIKIINDGKTILGTGGGVNNILSKCNTENFIVFNPDTIWNENYFRSIKKMKDVFIKKKLKNILLVVNKKLSFDKNLKGDFQLIKNKLKKGNSNNFIYTGCQILNREIFNGVKMKNFSMQFVWNKQILKNNLYAVESKSKFLHVTDLRIYQKLLKNN